MAGLPSNRLGQALGELLGASLEVYSIGARWCALDRAAS